MEFFRWILVITGIVLLGVAFMLGRNNTQDDPPRRAKPHAYDPKLDDLPVRGSDPAITNSDIAAVSVDNAQEWQSDSYVEGYADNADDHYRHAPGFEQPGFAQAGSDDEGFNNQAGNYEPGFDTEFDTASIEAEVAGNSDFGGRDSGLNSRLDTSGTDSELASEPGRQTSFASAVKAVNAREREQDDAASAENTYSLAEEFETYPEHGPGHKQGHNQGRLDESVQIDEFEEKLVSVHVVASSGRRFYGNDLKALFEQHGYTFGRMSLYHCALDGDIVFSIANMIKPGTFTEDKMGSFETLGITLFMRLPVELDSDVAFDFLIGEAKELAEELGGHLRDGSRNPLSEQTIQHMREEVQQYQFRSRQLHSTS